MKKLVTAVKMHALRLRSPKMAHQAPDEWLLATYDLAYERTPLEQKLLGPISRPPIRRRVDVVLQSRRTGRH